MLILLLACTSGPPGGASPTADDAMLTLVAPAAMDCGDGDAAQITATNTGETTWSPAEGYQLVPASADVFGVGPATLPAGALVPPGDAYTFVVPLVAPEADGAYLTRWTMEKVGVGPFGSVGEGSIDLSCGGGGSGGGGGNGGDNGGNGGGGAADRGGLVRLAGNTLVDDEGPFNALGATLMWGAWGYKYDRARLEANLAYLAGHGFHYVRVLGVVGDPDASDYWDDREVTTRWGDYDDVIAGFTDLAWDSYGLRTEWTLIGDGQITVPSTAEKYALVDRFLAMSQGREEKIILFEIANEAWQNGFPGDAGNDELRALSRYMRDRTDVLVAASAPAGVECDDYAYVYGGDVADIATIHFDRDTSRVEGAWRPVRQPWELEYCDDVPVGANNEPIGPGSSVASDDEPIRLVSAAVTTYVANLPFYVFHSHAGVRGDENLYDTRGVDSFTQMARYVPAEVASWERQNAHWSGSPFVVYAVDSGGREYGDTMWVDLGDPVGGAVRMYSDTTGSGFFSIAIGVIGELRLDARRALEAEAIDPLTGDVVASASLDAGQRWILSGHEAYVVRGEWR